MTPKEKAQELNSYFYELVADTPDPEWRAKQAALIAVDEIILSRKDDSQFDDTLWSGDSDMYTMHPMYLKYWQEVKQELENL